MGEGEEVKENTRRKRLAKKRWDMQRDWPCKDNDEEVGLQ